MFIKLDKYLSSSFTIDYWSDEGIGIAEELICTFTSDDWIKLKTSIESRNMIWLIKCAEILGEHEKEVAVDVLMELALNNNVEVQIAALDSINSLLSLGFIDEIKISEIRYIVSGIKKPSIVVGTMLKSLEVKLNDL